MDSTLAARILTVLDEEAPIHFALPVPLEKIGAISINSTDPNKRFLRLQVLASSEIISVAECVPEDVTPFEAVNAVLLRTWASSVLYLEIMFGNLAPRYILTRCTPNTGISLGVTGPGNVIGHVQSETEVAFLTSNNPATPYLDPAIVVRLLAFFGDPYEQLLMSAIAQDPSDSFGLQRFFDFYDAFVEPVHQKLFYQQAIRAEFEARTAANIPTDLDTQSAYRFRFPGPAGGTISRADVVAGYHSTVEASQDKFTNFYINELNLSLSIFRADTYEMELLDIRDFRVRFHTLATASTGCKIIVNGPVFDAGICGKQSPTYRMGWYNAAVDAANRGMDMTGKTKGTIVFRGQPSDFGDCPIPDDPQYWTYHFGQTVNGTYQLVLNPIPWNHDYACAVEPAIGVFRNGQRIGTNHEIDQLGSDGEPRKMPDKPYAEKLITQGIPIIGRCQRGGTEYLFILIRPDSYKPNLNTANWEQLIALMRDIGVIDAFITDGDDSVGLIIDDVLHFIPGLKKDSPMPLAIGFRKV